MPAEPVPRRPSPVPREIALFAAAISFLLPGVGHLLVRAWARGLLWSLGSLVVALAGGGVALLLLMAIAAIDAYVFARDATQRPKETQS